MMTDHPPLTEEEQATRDHLNHQQAMADWDAAEQERLAKLAAIQPVIDVLGDKAAVSNAIEQLALFSVSAAFTLDQRLRFTRLLTTFGADVMAFAEEAERLATPIPQPELVV